MDKRLLRYLILGSLFFIPLIGPYQGFGYEKTKILFFILSISLIGLAELDIWFFTKPKLKWDLIKIASLIFILILFATSGLGIDFRASFLGKDPYFQGLALYCYLFLFSLLVSSVKIKLEHVAMVLTGCALVVSLVAIQSWVTLNIFNIPVSTYAGRVVSTFGQPNFYSGFLLLTLPFSYYLFKYFSKKKEAISKIFPSLRGAKRRGNLYIPLKIATLIARDDISIRFFGLISGLISVIGIFISYSRSAILLAFVLLIWGLLNQLKFRIRLILIFSAVFIMLIALKFSSSTFGIVWNEFSYPNSTNNPDLTKMSVEKRAYIWPVAWQIIIQQPVTGYGLENINQAFANYFAVNKHLLFEENLKISPILISLKELNIDRSHNYILDLLLFSGIPGLTAWTILVSLLFWKLIRKPRSLIKNILFVSLVTYLVWIQFQNQSVVHLIYFWILVGLIDQEED